MKDFKLEFLCNDDVFFAVSKPSNIHSCINFNKDNVSIAKILLDKYPFLENVAKKEDAGLLNRLDFETSGILYGAWHKEDYQKLKSLSDKFTKTYIAITEGKTETKDLTTYLGSPYRGAKKVRVYSVNKNPKRALLCKSQVKLIKYDKEKDLSLVNVKITKGMRHQIRAHLSYLGTPLLGDTLYGAKRESKDYFNFENLPKFLLHNVSLSLRNLVDDKIINISCECRWENLF